MKRALVILCVVLSGVHLGAFTDLTTGWEVAGRFRHAPDDWPFMGWAFLQVVICVVLGFWCSRVSIRSKLIAISFTGGVVVWLAMTAFLPIAQYDWLWRGLLLFAIPFFVWIIHEAEQQLASPLEPD